MGGLHSKAGLLADGWAQIPWSLIRVNIKTYSRALFVPLKTTPLTGHTNALFKESPFLNVYFFLNFGDRWLDGLLHRKSPLSLPIICSVIPKHTPLLSPLRYSYQLCDDIHYSS